MGSETTMPDDPLRIEFTFPASPATPGFEYMQIAEDGAAVRVTEPPHPASPARQAVISLPEGLPYSEIEQACEGVDQWSRGERGVLILPPGAKLLSTLPTIDEIERDLLQMQAEARRVMDQDVDEREAWAALRTIADGAEDG